MLCQLTLHTPKRHPALIRTLLHVAPSRAYASAAKSKLKSPATQTDTAEPLALKASSPTETGAESSPNQLVIDKLTELRALHAANGRPDDKWRVLTYDKAIRALRSYDKPLECAAQARSIPGIGEKTAAKIMEIMITGSLRRIDTEDTEEVRAVRIFQGIYSVGPSTAHGWYAAGCRTLDDVRERRGGISVSASAAIGLEFYDDINERMPREEAGEIFEHVKAAAREIDSKLEVQIMGSFRRGKPTVGDIDVLLTRDTADGHTHAGALTHVLAALRERGVVTHDLALPHASEPLEGVYRGLCQRPGVRDAKKRRIDVLAVPWDARGAALIYYTGDDIFNRALRRKAADAGFTLNQRGLWADVVRNPRSKAIVEQGRRVASSEEEIFRILDEPWREPHERSSA